MKFGLITNIFRKVARLGTAGFMVLTIASCGGGGGSPGTASGGSGSAANGSSGSTATTPTSVSLLFSSPELPSSGASGTEVTVTALIKNSNNNVVADVPVTFTADSGALTGVSAESDANGRATALLGASGDSTNRTITVTAQAGNITATGTVNVVGTTVTVTGPSTITSGGTGDFTISVKNSAGVAVANRPVTISSSKGNAITVTSSGGGTATAPLTNSQGQVVVRVSGSQSGNDTLSISAQGANTTAAFAVNAVSLTVRPVDASGNAVTEANTSTSCTRIAVRYENAGAPQAGTVNISASRGTLYTDSACTTVLGSGSVPVVAGDGQAYLKSDTVGIATITATVTNGPTAQTDLEFVAALTANATINVQADPAVIGANSGTGQSEKSTLTVVVRDGTVNNNLVKGAVIEFNIVSDPSGGTLTTPVATTESNGSATVAYIAGSATTPTDGVVIQAKIQGTSKTDTTTLTVSQKALFITAGTGNSVAAPSSTHYQKDYSVFVTDASGNPVPNVAITASLRVTRYKKGSYALDADDEWEQVVTGTCTNEDSRVADTAYNGVLDPGEDFNNNGVLDPGTSPSVTGNAQTDSSGIATVSILYPKDRGAWTEVVLTVSGSVSGTEPTYSTNAFFLPVLASDFSNKDVEPPGSPNPYGANACNVPG